MEPICLRDLEEVAVVATQSLARPALPGCSWRSPKLVTTPHRRRHARLAPALVREFTARYDALVAAGIAATPIHPEASTRGYYQRKAYNLVTVFADRASAAGYLRFMNDLDTLPVRE